MGIRLKLGNENGRNAWDCMGMRGNGNVKNPFPVIHSLKPIRGAGHRDINDDELSSNVQRVSTTLLTLFYSHWAKTIAQFRFLGFLKLYIFFSENCKFKLFFKLV